MFFPRAENSEELSYARTHEVNDIVERVGVLAPSRLHIKNHPIDTPVAAFNPAAMLVNDRIILFVRVILGYFMYASAIARVEVPVGDVLSGRVSTAHYSGEIVVYPDTGYDIWGAEDPRVVKLGDTAHMIYTGRTVNYFNPAVRSERTLPVLASSLDEEGFSWDKKAVFVLPSHLKSKVISDKDAFLFRWSDTLFLFHRPHMMVDETHYLVVSKVGKLPERGIEQVEVSDTTVLLEPAHFEEKLGWAAPPVEVDGRHVVLLHGVGKGLESYRVLAGLLDPSPGKMRFRRVTRSYIMAPRESYEIYGDRPATVFPCGLVNVDGKLVLTYGAADLFVGFGVIEESAIMNALGE